VEEAQPDRVSSTPAGRSARHAGAPTSSGALTRRPAEDRLLNVKEAAAMLSMKPSTLYQWAHERRIPTVKLYRRALRFRLSVIQSLIAKGDRPALRPIADVPGEDLD
jgi:excisionase family DNA binding protein